VFGATLVAIEREKTCEGQAHAVQLAAPADAL
jgi:hypothetical protein